MLFAFAESLAPLGVQLLIVFHIWLSIIESPIFIFRFNTVQYFIWIDHILF